tara:strand:- start:1100 stop:2167 length:1068 start_codon:yes stop_codon:yes gene_type:complete
MNPNNLILIWTPKLDEVNGQNLVTRRVLNILSKYNKNVYQYSKGGGYTILKTLFLSGRLIIKSICNRNSTIYLVCSRSIFGFFRDLPILLLSTFGTRLIVHLHGSDLDNLFNNKFLRCLTIIAYKKCELISPSEQALRNLNRSIFKKVYICDNFFSQENYHIEKYIKKQVNEPFIILWNSNIISSKGICEVFNAMLSLTKSKYNVKLIILGKFYSDEEKTDKEMMNFINEILIYDWIEYRGEVPNKDLGGLLAISDAIILPSTYKSECQPLAIIEGMLFAKHIIVTNTPALRTTVGNYPAKFVLRDAKSIADNLCLCINNNLSSLKNRIEASLKMQERFSTNKFDKTISSIILKE